MTKNNSMLETLVSRTLKRTKLKNSEVISLQYTILNKQIVYKNIVKN